MRSSITATVTSKGQVTLPAEARSRLAIRAGTKLERIVKGDGRMDVVRVGGSIHDLKGMLPKPKKALSVEEMGAAVAKGARRAAR